MMTNHYIILKLKKIEDVSHIGLWTNDTEFSDLIGIPEGVYPEGSREYDGLMTILRDFTHHIVGYANDINGTIVQISREIYSDVTYLEALYTKVV